MTVDAWTPLDEAAVVRDRWIDLRRERCRLPSGVEVEDYYVLHYPEWVNVVAVTAQGRFVRVRQWRQGVREVVLELPGGVVDPGETPEAAGVRELLEETGYRGGSAVSVAALWANPASQTNRIHTLLVLDAEPVQAPQPEPTEQLEVEVVDAAAMLADLRAGRMAHGLHMSGVFAALLHRPDLLDLRP